MVYKLGIGLEEIPMPWKETCAMDEKKAFLAAYLEGDTKMTALCQGFGISRPTGYAVIERYLQDPESYHRESSRAPHHHPNETPRRLVQLIMKQRRKQPAWGPVTIRSVLERTYPDELWPAASTIGAILKREGAIPAAPKRRLGAIPRSTALTEPAAVNEVWGIDDKGQFRTGDCKYCYPLTLTDRYSRFVLGCVGRRTVAEAYARGDESRALADGSVRYGVPTTSVQHVAEGLQRRASPPCVGDAPAGGALPTLTTTGRFVAGR